MNDFRTEIESKYFEWLCGKIQDSRRRSRKTYRKVFEELYSTTFTWSVPLDKNRASDGTALRYIFAMEEYGDSSIENYLPNTDANVLEVMIALADRIDREYTGDPISGSQAYIWFWRMMGNLGLDGLDDSNFDRRKVEFIIFRLLNRQYRKDGLGGLFYLPYSNEDISSMEIWKQAMRYVNLNKI